MSDINLSNLQVPPAITMPMHVAESNPHPQYVRLNDLSSAVKGVISVSDLKDVDVGENQANNTLLIFNAGTYRPITVTELGTQITIPYATDTSAGIIRIAQTIWETDNCATTPRQVVEYVTSNSYTLPEAQEYTLGGVTLYQIRSIALSVAGEGNNNFVLEYATTTDIGGVVLATNQEVLAGTDATKVITPATLATALNNISEYALPMATFAVRGGVKTVDMTTNVGKADIANIINTNPASLGEYVPLVTSNQFVVAKVNAANYYKAFATPIASDADAEAAASNLNATVEYIVNSTGILSGRSAVGTNDYTNVSVIVKENGAAYDINTHGQVKVFQEGTIKRLTVGKTCYAQIQGEAHNVLISADTNPDGIYGGVDVANHGHVTYCTITGYGKLKCAVGFTDSDNITHSADAVTDAIVENVVISDTVYTDGIPIGALIIEPKGKGYNITLTGSKAAAYIRGYAKDVVVHSGCCVWADASTTKIDNLILYTGAEIKLSDGATITGCVVHPGAVVSLPPNGTASINYNTCRETEHPILIIKSRVVDYFKDETRKEYGVTTYTYEKPDGTVTSSVTLPQLSAFFEPKGNSIVHNYTDGTSTITTTGINRVYVWAIDTPCGFRRIDTSATSTINSMLISGISAGNADEYTRQTHLASTYISAQIISHVKTGTQITNFYALEVPTSAIIYHTNTSDYEAHMVNELTSESDRYKYSVVF